MLWKVTTKADQRPRLLADRHYTRQSVGHPMWTRPGYNQILYFEQANGRAASFCWWRPKWESGIKGTERKDGLRCIECAIFRNETRYLSSNLIRAAVEMVLTWEHALDVEWPDGLITGIGSKETAAGRHPDHKPGHCFREAGWVDFSKNGGRADVWLKIPRESLPLFKPLTLLSANGSTLNGKTSATGDITTGSTGSGTTGHSLNGDQCKNLHR